MKNTFSLASRHTISQANINFYATPFIHPQRNMNTHDFIYLLQGGWKLGQNEEIFELKKDSVLILFAGNNHFGVEPCLNNTKTMYFHVSREESDFVGESPENDSNEICLDSLIDASNNKNIKKYFSQIVNCYLSGNQKKSDILFDLLLCELTENQLYTTDIGIANQIKNIIHSNPEKFFSNAELAAMTNVSTKTAETKFKLMFGITIHQYILNFKIEEAMSYLIRFPQISIKEIAHNLGFYDEYHFSKQFKKIVGISPSIFKSKNHF